MSSIFESVSAQQIGAKRAKKHSIWVKRLPDVVNGFKAIYPYTLPFFADIEGLINIINFILKQIMRVVKHYHFKWDNARGGIEARFIIWKK